MILVIESKIASKTIVSGKANIRGSEATRSFVSY